MDRLMIKCPRCGDSFTLAAMKAEVVNHVAIDTYDDFQKWGGNLGEWMNYHARHSQGQAFTLEDNESMKEGA